MKILARLSCAHCGTLLNAGGKAGSGPILIEHPLDLIPGGRTPFSQKCPFNGKKYIAVVHPIDVREEVKSLVA